METMNEGWREPSRNRELTEGDNEIAFDLPISVYLFVVVVVSVLIAVVYYRSYPSTPSGDGLPREDLFRPLLGTPIEIQWTAQNGAATTNAQGSGLPQVSFQNELYWQPRLCINADEIAWLRIRGISYWCEGRFQFGPAAVDTLVLQHHTASVLSDDGSFRCKDFELWGTPDLTDGRYCLIFAGQMEPNDAKEQIFRFENVWVLRGVRFVSLTRWNPRNENSLQLRLQQLRLYGESLIHLGWSRRI